ncbi:MAG: thioredoxin family protein [Sedimentisphaerales bacterium]|nr:thioredoxin family protein [Sedimentisphaerales bacterium]
MKKINVFLAVLTILLFISPALLFGQDTVFSDDIVSISLVQLFETVRPESSSAVAVNFSLAKDWHFYADAETAPGRMNLKITPQAGDISFDQAVMPDSKPYYDKGLQKELQVFSDEFTVYIPFNIHNPNRSKLDIDLKIEGAVCSGAMCQLPGIGTVTTSINIDPDAEMSKPAFALQIQKNKTGTESYSAPIAFIIAVIAGLILNIMPCVWPVIPIIVMRIWNLSGEKRTKSITMGLGFCAGILLFFVVLAAANIVLRLGYGVVFQWGDHFRNPAFVTAMTLLMVVLGLFMFGVFNIGIPASVTGRATGGKGGLGGSIAMGFLAALLATPCSFAILAAAFAWAQTQTLPIATFTIMLIGVGMAAPYMILTSMPKLLEKMPKPGQWMERVKQGMGFLLLLIGVKLLGALPGESRVDVLFYILILSFCVWMWGTWVTYSTTRRRKYAVRLVAVSIAVGAGFIFLSDQNSKNFIEWQKYDRDRIAQAVEQDRPVLIKFTADWCTSCMVVDRFVFKRKDVAELIKQKGIAAFKGDTTSASAAATFDLANVYNEPGVPVTVLLLSDGTQPHLRGLIGKKDIMEILEKLPDKKIQ